jgi:hypothetical protein
MRIQSLFAVAITQVLAFLPLSASASECSPEGEDVLSVPHEGAVLPTGFRVVWSEHRSGHTLEIRDALGAEVALDVRDGESYAPVDLPTGAYSFAVHKGEADEAVTAGDFSVVEDVPGQLLSVTNQALILSTVEERTDGCGDQPEEGDVLARVAFDAAGVSYGAWWISLEVATPEGALLGVGAALVSPPISPGSDRGVAVNLGSNAPEEVCGRLSVTSPDGDVQETEDLGCHSLDECGNGSSGGTVSFKPPLIGCSTVGSVAPAGTVLVGIGFLLGLTRRRRRYVTRAA